MVQKEEQHKIKMSPTSSFAISLDIPQPYQATLSEL